MEFKPAKCPSCSGDLQLPDNVEKVKCMYCSTDVIVKDAIKLAAAQINPENIFKLADAALESANYAEAYTYYTKILEVDPDNHKAWFGKAVAAARQSTLANLRIMETVKGIEIAIEKAPDIEKHKLKILAAANLVSLATAIYKVVYESFMNYVTLDNIHEMHPEFIARMELLVFILEIASNYNPDDRTILVSIINLNLNCMTSYWDSGVYRGVLVNESPSLLNYTKSIYNKAESKILETEKKMQRIDPSYKATYPRYQVWGEKKINRPGCCFIATAVYGDYNSPEVLILRSFRDNFLSKTISGRLFIKSYYCISPPIAQWLKGQERIKVGVKFLLDRIVIFIKRTI